MRTVASTLSLAALSALAGACTAGAVDVRGAGDDDASEAERAAIESFDKQVMPILSDNCAACHATMANIDFLKSEPDVRQRVMGWPGLVALDAPNDSLLLGKGAHEGPAFTIEQATIVLDWIQLERAAAGGEESAVELDPFQPIAGLNTIDLGAIGLVGSSISFRMEPLSVGMYLSEIVLTGGPDGAHLVHPLFVVWQAATETPEPDPIDRFAGLDLSVTAGQQAMIGGGTAVFVDVPPDSMLSLHFELAEPGSAGGAGGEAPAGCKAVAAFTAAAQPALAASCVSCHGGANSSATNATSMAEVGDTSPEAQARACAQILSRVNLADPPNSGIFVAPDPGSGASHPFKFNGDPNAFAAFQSQLTQWIDQEKAP